MISLRGLFFVISLMSLFQVSLANDNNSEVSMRCQFNNTYGSCIFTSSSRKPLECNATVIAGLLNTAREVVGEEEFRLNFRDVKNIIVKSPSPVRNKIISINGNFNCF